MISSRMETSGDSEIAAGRPGRPAGAAALRPGCGCYAGPMAVSRTFGASRPAPAPEAANLFETPVIVDHPADAPALNDDLRRVIEQRRAHDPGVSVSNVAGWHSDRRMLEWGGDAARRLCERVVATADQFTVDIRGQGEPRFRWQPEMWANVSPPGASNRHHCHPGAFWSAVYYVDDGYGGSSDAELGGELVLFDPRMPMIRMGDPDLRFRRAGRPPDHDESWMRPVTGRLVIFPAWLNHAVREYRGSGLRISIAVNLTAVPRSA